MNTKKLALTIVFAALAIALNPSFTYIQLMAPYAYGLIYQIWEIPIVVAFLIISPVAGVSISLLNTAVLLAVFPGVMPTGPIYNLSATLSMQAGIFAAATVAKRYLKGKTENPVARFAPKWVAFSTTMGIITRVLFMSIVLYFALPQPSPIGFSMPIIDTVAYLPLAAVFNSTLALYTIPIGYLLARTVTKNLRLNQFV